MEFPYKFTAQFTSKIQLQPIQSHLEIYPLYLILKNKNQQKEYHYLDLKFQKPPQKYLGIHSFLYKDKPIYFKIKNKTDYNILEKIFQSLIPLGQFQQQYLFSQILAEDISTPTLKLYIVQHKKTRFNYLVRSLNINKKNTTEELQIMRKINHRCGYKPIETYIESKKNEVKLVYNFFKGIYLKSMLKKKRKYEQDEIKVFITRMLFFLQNLQELGVNYNNLQQSIILVNNKLQNPIIIDFSQSFKYNKQSKKQFIQQQLKSISQILFRLVFNKNLDKNQSTKLNNYILKNITDYHQSFNIYSKNCFNFLNLILNSKNLTIKQLVKHKWLIQKKYVRISKLKTIKSLYNQQKSLKYSQQQEDSLELSNTQQYDPHSTKVNDMMKSYLLNPFNFRAKFIDISPKLQNLINC